MNYPVKPSECPDSVGAMPLRGRSGLLRTAPLCGVVAVPEPAAIAGPSPAFVSLTRNPDLPRPSRFEPTIKAEGDIVL